MSQKKYLDTITLVAISDVKINETIRSLIDCLDKMDFAYAKLITSIPIQNLPDNIILEKPVFELDSGDKYNEFIFRELFSHINTEHCLIVQHDSRIINPQLWDDKWLLNDYGGAPWLIKNDAYICHDTGEHIRVGNGGFSIRSHRLLEIPKKYDILLTQEQNQFNEDGNTCIYHRTRMLELGVKYMPLEEALIFSHELDVPEYKSQPIFGFHKYPPFQKTIFNSVVYL
jgi:hypothetical protein